ncbi:MAG: hypothetical protein HY718_02065 [Planctomycetes bacterium]|nr:hypothetical protein [Planctomycetota bacterium]
MNEEKNWPFHSYVHTFTHSYVRYRCTPDTSSTTSTTNNGTMAASRVSISRFVWSCLW